MRDEIRKELMTFEDGERIVEEDIDEVLDHIMSIVE